MPGLPIRWARLMRQQYPFIWTGILRATWQERPDLIGRMQTELCATPGCQTCAPLGPVSMHIDNVCGAAGCYRGRDACADRVACGGCQAVMHRDPDHYCTACNKCNTCCRCVQCTGCNRRGIACERCNTCTGSCCNCQHCSSCSRPVGSTCGDCGRCEAETEGQRNCCRCTANGIRFVNRGVIFHEGESVDDNPTKRFVAAEIEVDGLGDIPKAKAINAVIKKWSAAVVRDGSLSGNGFEINTAPASGNKFMEQMAELGTTLALAKGVINDRCGLHVHIDARDFAFKDIQSLIRIYAGIEEALFALVPKTRRESRYCMPVAQKYMQALEDNHAGISSPEKRLDFVVYGTTEDRYVEQNKRNKYNEARYGALNLHSWFYRQTIECRLHPGTIDPFEIQAWGVLWAMILDAAKAGYKPEGKTAYQRLVDIASRNRLSLAYVVGKTKKYRKRRRKAEVKKAA